MTSPSSSFRVPRHKSTDVLDRLVFARREIEVYIQALLIELRSHGLQGRDYLRLYSPVEGDNDESIKRAPIRLRE